MVWTLAFDAATLVASLQRNVTVTRKANTTPSIQTSINLK